MTAHVAFETGPFTVVVGDRLLTLAKGGRLKTWDPLANKTLLVRATNGIVVVSYAGLAHIRGLDTDEWLLQKISGVPDPPMHHGHRPMQMAGPPMDINIGSIRKSIKDAIKAEFLTLPAVTRNNNLEVLLAGWTWNPRKPLARRFSETITAEDVSLGRATVDRGRYLRVTPQGSRYRISGIGNMGAHGERIVAMRDMFESLRVLSMLTPAVVEAAIVAEMRSWAKEPDSGIGNDFMSVTIAWGESPLIRFNRDISSGATSQAFWPAYVDCRGSVMRPSVTSGQPPTFGELGSGTEVRMQTDPPVAPTTPTSMTSAGYFRPPALSAGRGAFGQRL